MLFKKSLFFTFASILTFLLSPYQALMAQEVQLTPLIAQVLEPPQAVLGSDGSWHLVYELEVTNVNPFPWTVERIQVLSGKDNHRILGDYQGKKLTAHMRSVGSHGKATPLNPNETAIVWIHLSFTGKEKIPDELTHQFLGKSSKGSLNILAASTKIGKGNPVVISPPLKGDRWLAGDGCCEAKRHIRALLPINGKLYAAQRFAIDWEKLDANRQILSGDPLKVESYFCYGQEVYAVADAKVVRALDGLPNQIPGKLPDKISLPEADGNHIVLELSPGRYALYAHLKPGSLRVKTGDQVKTGQVLALVGNSGNTSEPHLHFHVMDSPSPLASNGLPYVFSKFNLVGRAPSTEAFDQAAAQGNPLEILPVAKKGIHEGELPLDLSLVNFP